MNADHASCSQIAQSKIFNCGFTDPVNFMLIWGKKWGTEPNVPGGRKRPSLQHIFVGLLLLFVVICPGEDTVALFGMPFSHVSFLWGLSAGLNTTHY